MLCSLSASFIMRTLISFDIARNIFRKFSAWISSFDSNFMVPSLVTPSTKRAISSPKSATSCSLVYSVSSTTSCKSPPTIVASSIPISARIRATLIGCIKYGSPLFRSWPSCKAWALSNALPIKSVLYLELILNIFSKNSAFVIIDVSCYFVFAFFAVLFKYFEPSSFLHKS